MYSCEDHLDLDMTKWYVYILNVFFGVGPIEMNEDEMQVLQGAIVRLARLDLCNDTAQTCLTECNHVMTISTNITPIIMAYC